MSSDLCIAFYSGLCVVISIALSELVNILLIKFNKNLFWRLYKDKILDEFENDYLQERWDKCD